MDGRGGGSIPQNPQAFAPMSALGRWPRVQQPARLLGLKQRQPGARGPERGLEAPRGPQVREGVRPSSAASKQWAPEPEEQARSPIGECAQPRKGAGRARAHRRGLTDLGAPSDLAHLPAPEVLHRLHDLVARVHHERPVVHHRLADRHAGEQEQPAGLSEAPRSRTASPAPSRASWPSRTSRPLRRRAAPRRRRRRPAPACSAGSGTRDVGARLERPVLVDDGRVRVDDGARRRALRRR